MDERYSEQVNWKAVALALAIWAAHFSVLWGASSIFPGLPAARWIALFATIAAAGALALLWRSVGRREPDSIPRLSIGLASAAIAYGALPALVG
jgi:low temperature requirement protein LtrA